MNIKWNEKKLSDIATMIDYRGKTPQKSTSGIPLITAKIVKNGTILPANEFIAESQYASWMTRGDPCVGDVVMTTEAPLGEVAQLRDAHVALAQRIITIRGKKDVLDNGYLKYFLQSAEGQGRLRARETGTTVTGIKAAELRELMIPFPNIVQQRKISKVLLDLDEKIYNLRQENHNLEEQAKAIFKSWFVDFEPFQNGKFVDSELGKIPEGWRVGTLNEIADITMGQSPQGASYNENAVGTVFYQGRAEFTDRFPSRRLFTTEPKRMANAGDVLLSVRAPVGDLNIANEPCCIGRGLAAIHAKNGFASFIFYTMQALKTELEKYNGEGTVFGCINKDSLSSQKVIIPPRNIIADFESIASSLDCQYFVDFNENIHLAQLRDTLLPKLMSGEIDVSEVEI